MEQERQFKGIWIPKEVWLAENLNTQEKLLLVEIDSLETDDKGCFASNKYFSDFFKLSTQRVSQIIQNLSEKGYIKIDYIKEGKAIKERQIRICKPPYPEVSNIFDRGIKYSLQGYQENFKDNNIIHDKINNNIIHVEQIIDYMNELAGTHFKTTTKKTQTLIRARLAEGFTVDEIKDVIYAKYNEWYKKPVKFKNGIMSDTYYRPDTLFGTKFEGYLESYKREYK